MRVEAELNNSGPERIALENRAKIIQTQLDAAKQRVKQIESDRKKLELDVEAKKGQIAKYALQQFQTKKNEEYRALAHEIEMCRDAITKLEDQQLELMEQAETATREMNEISRAAATTLKDVELAKAALNDKEVRLKKELETLQSDYSRLEEAVEEGVRDKYIRLRRQKGASTVVGIDRGICGGCHMKLPMQVIITCQGQQELVSCPNCGRILYFTREMELAVA